MCVCMCVTYTGGVAVHGILSISLKALNLLIYPPMTGADQAGLWLTGRKGRIERQEWKYCAGIKKMHNMYNFFSKLSSVLSLSPMACAAHGETVSLGKSSGERLGLRGDVLGSGPPQRERHGRTWLDQSRLAPEEALLQQCHRPSQVPSLRWITGA